MLHFILCNFNVQQLYIPLILFYLIIGLYLFKQSRKIQDITQNLEEEKMHNQSLEKMQDAIRCFRHDFNNIVQSIGGYISTNNIEGLKMYYNDLLEECQLANNLSTFDPNFINNPALYKLLSDKYCLAEKIDVKFTLEIFSDLSNLNIKAYELTRILGILLDNAIEASSKCDKKVVNVTFRNDKNKLLIIIQNTYINKDINIDKIFEKGYSSKEASDVKQSHGLGLWEVRKYLRKRTNLDLYTTKTDEFFTQQFEIYN